MKNCVESCRLSDVSCPCTDCRFWVDHEQDLNCVFESINKHGQLTLRETADRLGISFVRVKQIEDKALKKMRHLTEERSIY